MNPYSNNDSNQYPNQFPDYIEDDYSRQMNFPWFMFPPFYGPQGGGHHNPPNWNPGGQHGPNMPPQQSDMPTSPPPSFTPQQPNMQAKAVDPGGIRGCMYRNTYVWLNHRESFWFYPTFVGRNSIAGYRWRGYRWVYYGIDLDRIQSFQCY